MAHHSPLAESWIALTGERRGGALVCSRVTKDILQLSLMTGCVTTSCAASITQVYSAGCWPNSKAFELSQTPELVRKDAAGIQQSGTLGLWPHHH